MPRAFVLNQADNVATLIDDGRQLEDIELAGEGKGRIQLSADISYGHKCAISQIPAGNHVIKYGQVIGRATHSIAVGEHVHVHNLEALRGRGDLQERS